MPPLWDRACSLHLFSGGFARLVLCPQTPLGLCPWTSLEDFRSPGPWAGCVHAPLLLYMYLLSSTWQRFAVFRLSINQVPTQVDKTYSSCHKWQYHSNIVNVNFVKDASVDFSVYKNPYNNCCQMSFPSQNTPKSMLEWWNGREELGEGTDGKQKGGKGERRGKRGTGKGMVKGVKMRGG